MKLHQIEIVSKKLPRPLKFQVRPETSDRKAIQETIERNTYQKKGITVEPGDQWADMGCNVGGFSCLAAVIGARVTAFEADTTNAALARNNLRVNGYDEMNGYQVVNAAIVPDDFEGDTVNLHVVPDNRPLGLRRHSIMRTSRGSTPVPVQAIKFSAAADRHCVKMNIEGAEIGILKAAERFTSPKLVLEWSFDHDKRCETFWAVMRKLERFYHHVAAARRVPETGEWKFYPPNNFIYAHGLK